jgi:hypothetical protein
LAPPEMRGRVMGVYIFLFQGTAPLGNLFIGSLAEYWSVSGTVVLSAAMCGLGIAGGLLYRLKHKIIDDPESEYDQPRSTTAD